MLKRRDTGGRDVPRLVFIVTAAVALIAAALYLILLLSAPDEPDAPDTPRATAAPNTLDSAAFYREDGFLRYADGAHLVGIDVSTHQGVIDWQAVRGAGVEFAILRVGYRGSTQGKLYEDEQFGENLRGAKAAGLRVGAYFFSQARDETEAEQEAEFACRLLNGETLDLPVFFDWETVDDGTHAPPPGEVELTACALAFCRAVERGGYDAGVYFYQSFGETIPKFV